MIKRGFDLYPRPGSNRHAFKGQGILSPSCLPIPPLRHLHKKSRTDSGPCGAENETRTRDPDLGKVVLYQLSYFRFDSRTKTPPSFWAENETRTRDPDLGKVVLYQLSYFRLASPIGNLVFPRFPLANCAAKIQLFSMPQTILRNFFFSFCFLADFKTNRLEMVLKGFV